MPRQYDPALQGVWRVQWIRINGSPPVKGNSLYIFGNYLLIQSHTSSFPLDYSVVMAEAPKRLILCNTIINTTQKAIYQIDGNSLLLCTTSILKEAEDLDFPSDFMAVPGNELVISELERIPVSMNDISSETLPALVIQYCGPQEESPFKAESDLLKSIWASRSKIAEETIQQRAISIGNRKSEHEDYAVAYHREMVESERIPFAIFWLMLEVNNGGFDQYLYNGTGAIAADTRRVLEKIGAPVTASLLAKALSLFPDNTPDPDVSARRRQLEAFTFTQRDFLSELDDQFYACEEDLYALAVKYLQL